MVPIQPTPRRLAFGAFEADLQTRELRKDGMKLKFSGQPFQVLAILLERPGQLVTREELQKRLWPDTFVDVERNLNTAVNKIREVLGDYAENPRFIETLPRRGYRFIGLIERPDSGEAEVPSANRNESSTGAINRGSWLRYSSVLLGVLIALVLAAIVYRRAKHYSQAEETVALDAVPFASFIGSQSFPSFSPDGSRVAFGWNAENAGTRTGFDLYVKAVGSETVLRLTHHPSGLISSAWSPDGTQIAIHRVDGADTGIYLVPALGGPERKVQETRIDAQIFRALPISWSPDGSWIAFAESTTTAIETRIFLLSTATWQKKRLESAPECQQESSPIFSHDGSYLAFACYIGNNESGLFIRRIKSSKLEKILTFQGFIEGLAWSAGDRSIVYSLTDTKTPSLREVSLKDNSVKRLVYEGSAVFPTISASGRLAFVSGIPFHEIWRMDLHAKSPVRLAPSTSWQQDVDISPDGKQITFQSGRSGVAGIWVSELDGTDLFQLSSARINSGSPQWSPDGKKIAYDAMHGGTWEIYVAGVAERIPKRLETGMSSSIRPHWSKDGTWIYFRSYDAGKEGIYRCPSSGGDAIRLTQDHDTFSPIEGLDSKTIYFVSHQWSSVLKTTNLSSVSASVLEGIPPLRDYSSWALGPEGIYFIPADRPNTLFEFETATGSLKQIFKLNSDFGQGLSVSADGRWIAFSQRGDLSSNIMFVDHLN